ncbi:MAG: hypothetical protein WD688_21225 [Candidatus Binatia bacterium]
MKVLIEMSPEHYELFVAECDITSREYSILKNSLVARDPAEPDRRTIKILCDKEEALQLLDAAKRLYPNAAPAISAGLDRAREE